MYHGPLRSAQHPRVRHCPRGRTDQKRFSKTVQMVTEAGLGGKRQQSVVLKQGEPCASSWRPHRPAAWFQARYFSPPLSPHLSNRDMTVPTLQGCREG